MLSFSVQSCTARQRKALPEPGAPSLRIVSMAPSSTSILIGLGLAGSLVAIDNWSAKIPGIPRQIPAYDLMKPDIERLAALSPDLLFVSSMTKEGSSRDPFKPLSDSGIKVIYIPTSATIDDIRSDVRRIAGLTGSETEGTKLIAEMDAEIGRIADIGRTIPEKSRRSVVFEIAAAPYIYSFGRGVYLNELIETAGAVNALAGEKGWISVSAETIVASDPDVILTNVAYLADPVAEIIGRPGWAGMKAVRNKRVFYIDTVSSSQPSPDAVKALREIAEAVYPEYFR